jgi:hypothetical protein
MRHVVKMFLRPDQLRRVRIYRREDGAFSFDEATFVIAPNGEQRWAPLPAYPTFCDTAETAEREARATISWLRLASEYSCGGK